MLVGFDFDNTLISYDRLFHQAALAQGLIPAATPPRKTAVRDHLRAAGREEQWTRLQGEVYGRRILAAAPYEGMLPALRQLADREIAACIVSHRTRAPYLGEPYDLHQAARSWLAAQGFFDPAALRWSADRAFFETTQEAKVSRIVELGCSHYVDDLPEILAALPESVDKILFAPFDPAPGAWKVMRAWSELPRHLGLA